MSPDTSVEAWIELVVGNEHGSSWLSVMVPGGRQGRCGQVGAAG